jgi:hypothetical protein
VRHIVHHVDDVTALERAKGRIRALTKLSLNKDRLAAFGAMIGAALGEAADPLAVIQTSAYLASRHRDAPARLDKHLARIGEQMKIVSPIFEKLATLAQEPPPSSGEMSLVAELTRIVEELEHQTPAASSPATVAGRLQHRDEQERAANKITTRGAR